MNTTDRSSTPYRVSRHFGQQATEALLTSEERLDLLNETMEKLAAAEVRIAQLESMQGTHAPKPKETE